MKNALLTSGLILIALLAMFNFIMIFDWSGPGLLISEIISAYALPLPLLLLFIRSKSIWVLPTVCLALIALGLPIAVTEFHSLRTYNFEYALIPLNILLAALCVISVASVNKTEYYSKSR